MVGVHTYFAEIQVATLSLSKIESVLVDLMSCWHSRVLVLDVIEWWTSSWSICVCIGELKWPMSLLPWEFVSRWSLVCVVFKWFSRFLPAGNRQSRGRTGFIRTDCHLLWFLCFLFCKSHDDLSLCSRTCAVRFGWVSKTTSFQWLCSFGEQGVWMEPIDSIIVSIQLVRLAIILWKWMSCSRAVHLIRSRRRFSFAVDVYQSHLTTHSTYLWSVWLCCVCTIWLCVGADLHSKCQGECCPNGNDVPCECYAVFRSVNICVTLPSGTTLLCCQRCVFAFLGFVIQGCAPSVMVITKWWREEEWIMNWIHNCLHK